MHVNFVFTLEDIVMLIAALFIFGLFLFCVICDKVNAAKHKSEQDSIKEEVNNEADRHTGS